MIADTPLATPHPSLGYRKRKFEPRLRPPSAIIVHTTGAGPANRLTSAVPAIVQWRKRNGFPSNTFESAIRIYQSVSEACGHYVVGQEIGQIAQLAPEAQCAWHVGGAGGRAYAKHVDVWNTTDTGWWEDRWPALGSPRELASGRLWEPYGHRVGLRVAWAQWRGGGSVNANTIAIEVACPLDDPRDSWTDAAWSNLVELVIDIAGRHEIPLTREHVLTHSDAHPLARSEKNKPWDPNTRQWSWPRFAAIAGIRA